MKTLNSCRTIFSKRMYTYTINNRKIQYTLHESTYLYDRYRRNNRGIMEFTRSRKKGLLELMKNDIHMSSGFMTARTYRDVIKGVTFKQVAREA